MILQKYFSHFKRYDWILFSLVISLVTFGLVALYSLGANSEKQNYDLLIKQGAAVLLGLAFLFMLSFIDYRFLRSYSNLLYVLGLLLLIGVLIFGISVRGTKGWFSIFGQVFQPVELVKITVVIFLSRYMALKSQAGSFYFRYLAVSGLIVAVPIILVLFQPDFGSAMILLALWLGMIALTKIKKSHLLLIFAMLALTFLFSWLFLLKDYQKDRLMTYVQPGKDPLGQGYNISQSIVAVGSGQFWGRGLSLGPQSRLNFLPAKETDFIFSVIGESLGFVGTFFILSLFSLLFWRIIKIMKTAQDDFAVFLSWGILLLIAVQVFINIGMNLGLAPVAGLPLPFISSGGSSVLVSLMAVGILESVYIRCKRSPI